MTIAREGLQTASSHQIPVNSYAARAWLGAVDGGTTQTTWPESALAQAWLFAHYGSLSIHTQQASLTFLPPPDTFYGLPPL
ncbi:hypothetical protein BsWGS_09659 [Bradybaena similaris]